jgi:hypothetical protein
MAYKLLGAAQERWRRFNGHVLVAGVTLKDGERLPDDEERRQTRRSPPDSPHERLRRAVSA